MEVVLLMSYLEYYEFLLKPINIGSFLTVGLLCSHVGWIKESLLVHTP